jgi:hypothetical protein
MKRFCVRSVFMLSLGLCVLPMRAACPTGSAYPPGGIMLTAKITAPDMFRLTNEAHGKAKAKLCMLTESDVVNGHTCANPDPLSAPSPLSIGLCTNGNANFNPTLTSDEIVAADQILVQFSPTEAGETKRTLRLEVTKADDTADFNRMYTIVGTAGVPDFAKDSRYKLWLYTGYTYLRTKSDFKDGYPEILARFETRLYDQRIFMKKHDRAQYDKIVNHEVNNCRHLVPCFPILRLYGETGLTGTTVQSGSGNDPNTAAPKVKQAFEGSFGIAPGVTLPVTTENSQQDTNAFSVLFPLRLGIITVPGVDAQGTTAAIPGRTAFNWSGNLRIENESGGNFEGTYFELGVGESEQFTRKKVPRLRADGLMPLNSGSTLFRFAMRLQLDTTSPFNKKENVEPGGEIRISILFNMDLKELARRFSG